MFFKNHVDTAVNFKKHESILIFIKFSVFYQKFLDFLRKNRPSTEEPAKHSEIKVKKRKKRTYKSVLDV